MSSTIIYHQVGVCFPKKYTGQQEDLFAIFAQAGASNCFEMGNGPNGCGRRSRSWQANAFGTAAQVMRSSIQFAGSCEGGMLKFRSARGDVTPEQYILKARNLLKAAVANDITASPIPFKESYVNGNFVQRPGTPEETKVYFHDQAGMQALFKSEDFWKQVESSYAFNYLKASGPEIRG